MNAPKQRVWMFYSPVDRECEWFGCLSDAEEMAQMILDDFPEYSPIQIFELLETERHEYTGNRSE